MYVDDFNYFMSLNTLSNVFCTLSKRTQGALTPYILSAVEIFIESTMDYCSEYAYIGIPNKGTLYRLKINPQLRKEFLSTTISELLKTDSDKITSVIGKTRYLSRYNTSNKAWRESVLEILIKLRDLFLQGYTDIPLLYIAFRGYYVDLDGPVVDDPFITSLLTPVITKRKYVRALIDSLFYEYLMDRKVGILLEHICRKNGITIYEDDVIRAITTALQTGRIDYIVAEKFIRTVVGKLYPNRTILSIVEHLFNLIDNIDNKQRWISVFLEYSIEYTINEFIDIMYFYYPHVTNKKIISSNLDRYFRVQISRKKLENVFLINDTVREKIANLYSLSTTS